MPCWLSGDTGLDEKTFNWGWVPFTWANQSVQDLGKWCAKLRVGKFHPGIAFTIQLYKSVLFTKQRPRRPETGIKNCFEEIEHESPFVTFSSNVQKDVFHLLSNRIFRKLFQRWLWRTRTRISICNIQFGETGLPFQMPRCSRKFSAGTTQKVVFHLLSIGFSGDFL